MSRRRGGTTEGRSEGPVHATCEVIARRREGAYWLVSVAAREIAERAQPGQFVQVAVEAPHTLLRRPFSIARVSRQGASAGTVDVVFDAHGPGTEWLTTVETHDVLDLVGPLGTPFPLPQRKVNCLLVGGGYGVGPAVLPRRVAAAAGLRVDVINGAATAERILGTIEAKRLSSSVTFTTEDGSYGTQGRVTDVLEQVATASRTGLVYACGPNPMLRAVSELCRDLGCPSGRGGGTHGLRDRGVLHLRGADRGPRRGRPEQARLPGRTGVQRSPHRTGTSGACPAARPGPTPTAR
jgi:dihydroorotate dehydrogenase electron transfer subunit